MNSIPITPIIIIGISSTLFIFSAFLTQAIRQYSLKKAILDIPNERSSHHLPTPRGGGLAIVTSFIISLIITQTIWGIDNHLFWALIVGCSSIAMIGYYDDVFSLSAKTRVFFHLIMACWAVYWLGSIQFSNEYSLFLSLLTYLFTVISIVWTINFYNFMDGIDGLASSEAIFISFVTGVLLFHSFTPALGLLMFLLTASTCGFLMWNWQPAKIFLGDIGSGFFGYLFSVIGLYTINHAILSLSYWWIILAIFICDATFTLILRIYQRKKFYSAHREHAYQCLIISGISHKAVTLSITIINLFLLLPLALTALQKPNDAIGLTGISTLILFGLWFSIKKRSFNNSTHHHDSTLQ